MEFFQGIYNNGQTVDLPISPVDGYQYSRNELLYLWQVYNSGNPNTGWITGPTSLWFCGWKVDQERRARSSVMSGTATPRSLRHPRTAFCRSSLSRSGRWKILPQSVSPTWTLQNESLYVQDLAYASDVLTHLNNNAKFFGARSGSHLYGRVLQRRKPFRRPSHQRMGTPTLIARQNWSIAGAGLVARRPMGLQRGSPTRGLGALYAFDQFGRSCHVRDRLVGK